MDSMESLRKELHRALDAVLDAYLPRPGQSPGQNGNGLRIEVQGEGDSWTFKWPSLIEQYGSYRDYRVAGDLGEATVRVARTTRPAFGRDDRGRAVVFGRTRSVNFYPWVEFTETDEPGAYSALVLDVTNPRRVIRDGEPLPPRFSGRDVRRTDELFHGVANGPTRRLVVTGDDEESMIEHAYWVASLKGNV